MRIRVLLLDDNQVFLSTATSFLSQHKNVEIVGAMTTGEQGLAALPELEPHLVLVDWSMPGIGGLETARRLKELSHAPHVVMLSLNDGPLYREAAESIKVDGYLSKKNWFVQLPSLIEQLREELGYDDVRAGGKAINH